jgi:hypothetical protein
MLSQTGAAMDDAMQVFICQAVKIIKLLNAQPVVTDIAFCGG